MMPQESAKLVSIILPIYNRIEFVKDAINSILNQTYPSIEIIMIDDGSTVDIKNFLDQSFTSEKIKYFKIPHCGLSGALNEGIRLALGRFIAFLDDDDFWDKDMIAKAMNQMIECNADLVAVGYSYVVMKDKSFKVLGKYVPTKSDSQGLLDSLSFKNIFPVNTILVKKDIVEKTGCFNTEMLTAMDWDLWFRVIASGCKVAVVDEILAHIRIHENNMSKDNVKMRQGALQVLENAQGYLNESQKKAVNLEGKLAYRQLTLGWYHCLSGNLKEGRERILSASQNTIIGKLRVNFICMITYLPNKILNYLNILLERVLSVQSYNVK